jgi:hypothetical protein
VLGVLSVGYPKESHMKAIVRLLTLAGVALPAVPEEFLLAKA